MNIERSIFRCSGQVQFDMSSADDQKKAASLTIKKPSHFSVVSYEGFRS